MAKKAKTVTLTPEQELIKQIGSGAVSYVSKDTPGAMSIVEQNLAVVNPAAANDAGQVPIQLTPSGQKVYNAMNTPSPVTAKAVSNGAAATAYAIIAPNAGFVKPEVKRGNKFGAGAPPKYPFADLDVGGSFFVGVTADMPEPVKTISSAASQANIRFSEGTGEYETKTRTKRGKGNKPLTDAAGNNVTETVQVEKRKPVRKFSVTLIEGGKTYGTWVAPESGAMVTRVL